jgi:hypothetical protein
MPFVTFSHGGETVHLLTLAPHSDVTAEFALPTESEGRGLTDREGRVALGNRVRTTIRFTVRFAGQQLAALRTKLQTLGNAPVAVPFWPLLTYWADRATIPTNAGFWLAFTPDWTTWAVSTSGVPNGYAATDYVAPLVVGRLYRRDDPEAIDEDCADLEIEVADGVPQSYLAPNSVASFTAGPSAAGTTPPLFPYRAEWGKPVSTGNALVPVDRKQLGQLRGTADVYYPQTGARRVRYGVTLAGTAWVELLRFFADRRATVKPLWLPGELVEARLTANVGSGDTSLQIDSAANLGANRHFLLDDLANRAAVVATSAAAPLPLSGAVGTAFDQRFTRLQSLLLARFAEDRLTVSLPNGETAETTLTFRELTTELTAPSGETFGTEVGALADRTFLYQFTLLYPGSPVAYRYTSHEGNVSDGTNTWTSAPFEHGDLRETLNLERVSLELRSRVFTGSPLNLFFPFALEFPLRVEVFEATLSGVSSVTGATRLFYGEVEDVSADGPILTVNAVAMGGLFERQLPRFLFGPQCNHSVYSPGCGANQASFTRAAVVAAAVTGSNTVTVQSSGAAWSGSTFAAHDYAGGLLIVGTGANVIQRIIADNTAPDGSGIATLTLAFPLTAALSAAASLVLGCDGEYATCSARFANSARFGGFPFMPVGNPSMVKVSSGVGGSKK